MADGGEANEGNNGAGTGGGGNGRGPGEYQVFIKSISGKTRTVYVTANTTVAQLKQQIQEKEGINPEEQRMIYSGKNLDDTKTMADYNLVADSTVHLVLRVRGGKSFVMG